MTNPPRPGRPATRNARPSPSIPPHANIRPSQPRGSNGNRYRRPVSKHRAPPPPSATPQQAAAVTKWANVISDLTSKTGDTGPSISSSPVPALPGAASSAFPAPTPAPLAAASSVPGTSASGAMNPEGKPKDTPKLEFVVRCEFKPHDLSNAEKRKKECEEKALKSKAAAAKWTAEKKERDEAEKVAIEKEEGDKEVTKVAAKVREEHEGSFSDQAEQGEDAGGEFQVGGQVGGGASAGGSTEGEVKTGERYWALKEFMVLMRARFPEVRGRLVAGGKAVGAADGATGGGGGRARRARARRGHGGNRA